MNRDFVRVVLGSINPEEGQVMRFSATGRPGESFTDREVFQQFGFQSAPPAGVEGIALVRGNAVYLIATDGREYRIALNDGEAVMYSSEGAKVHLKQGKTVVVSGADNIYLGDEDAGNVKSLVTFEDLKTYIDALTLPVSGAVAGPPTTPLPDNCATEVVKAK